MSDIKIPRSVILDVLADLKAQPTGNYSLEALQDALNAQPAFSGTLSALRTLATAGGRPICGIDIEATGTNPTSDKIVELAVVKVYPYGWLYPKGGFSVGHIAAGRPIPNRNHDPLKYTSKVWRINPGVEIPAEATAVHGITDRDVLQEAIFSQVAAEVLEFLTGCDVLSFNGNRFDVPMLCQHFDEYLFDWPAQGTRLYDASIIYREHVPRTLTAAVGHYLGHELEDAHGAEADTLATLSVFAAQLELDPALASKTPDELHELCQGGTRTVDVAGKIALNESGEPCFNFGTHKGKTLKSEHGYCLWMLRSDFPRNTKKHLARLLGVDDKNI